jgi:hypothetical protein
MGVIISCYPELLARHHTIRFYITYKHQRFLLKNFEQSILPI